jgi:hypothetical protein
MGKERPKRVFTGIKTELISGSKSYTGFIANLSEKGIGLYVGPTETAIDFAPRTKLEIKFQTPLGETLNLHCELKWLHTYNNPPHGITNSMGIEIIDAPPEYIEFFKTFL